MTEASHDLDDAAHETRAQRALGHALPGGAGRPDETADDRRRAAGTLHSLGGRPSA
ncbi:hypothetical protein [Streptomyces sp. WG7]|uniref:hypothetical protein n=1 Tax=Streptomyces sp. WG7 TaxID=3417650 RepID=UPI003CF4DB86